MKYEEASVSDLNNALLTGKTSATELLKEARRVIGEKDSEVRAFLEVFDSADEDAKRADEMIRQGQATALTGIPIAVKDNIVIADHRASAASKILEGFVSPYSATVIEKLKKQGAVFVGRTNMDEFAMGSSTEHSAYGATNNPSDTTRVPGGSSGGSAAAVAMGAVPLALGSDTGGSVRQPASFCGVVGLKPTYGSVSRHGLMMLASSLDCVGQFARTAEDAMILFDAVKSEEAPYDATVDLYADATKSGAPAKVIGIPDNLDTIGISKETKGYFDKTIQALEEQGYTTKKISLETMDKAVAMYYIIQPAEASSNLARFDGVRYGRRVEGENMWDEYIKSRTQGFGDEVTRRIVMGTYVLSAGYYDAYYRKAVAVRETMRKEYLKILQKVEVIMTPTTPDVAFLKGSIQDPVQMYAEDRLTLQANLVGLPAISVPMHVDGLPRGIHIAGNYNEEKTVAAYATTIEKLR